MDTLEVLKRAEEYGYITHEQACALAKKALGVIEEPAVETPPAEAPAEQPAA